jgi:CheY-like chemotaxis protein
MYSNSYTPIDAPRAPRVLVVEDELTVRADHAENLRRWGYTPVIAEGQGPALLDDAVHKARAYRCHIALVDMRLVELFPPDDESGLELVPRLLPTISIMVSGYGGRSEVRKALKDKGAFDFVGKEEGPGRLKQVLDKLAQDVYAGRRGVRIWWPAGLSSATIKERFFPDDDAVPLDEANDLLGLLFRDAQILKIEMLNGASRTPCLAPQSRAVILKVSESNREPVAVKIADTGRIRDEVRNYERFVRGRLGGNFYANLENHVVLWDLGGAIYKFIGASDQVVTFTTYYANNPPEHIQQTLERLFGRTWSRLYGDRRPQKRSLFAEYSHVWGEKWQSRLGDFPDQELLLDSPELPQHLPKPVAWLIKRVGLGQSDGVDASYFPDAYQAITHGDLQGDNVFVGEFREAWVIDYERTGWGPILQDFVELEVDILTRLAKFPAQQLPEFYKLITAVISPKTLGAPLPTTTMHPEALKALKVIRCLRRLAAEQTSTQDARQYLWGLLLNAVFRVTLLLKQEDADGPREESQPQQERAAALLLGSLICQRLDYWDSTWPPLDWPPVREIGLRKGRKAAPCDGHTVNAARPYPLSDQGTFAHGYAVLIGVGHTRYEPRWSLPVSVRDAQAMRQALIDPALCAYLPEHVRLLHDEDADATAIYASLRWLAEQTSAAPDATALVYFSGHGWRGPDARYALIPADVRPDQLPDSVLWGQEFTAAIRAIPARRLLVLIDACHAGGIATAKGDAALAAAGFSKASPSAELLRTLLQGEGRAVISSSREQQLSYVCRDDTMSIFTQHLIEALRGAANLPGETTVCVSNLINHLGKAVPASAWQQWQAEQTPWTDQASEDFAIGLLPGDHPGAMSIDDGPRSHDRLPSIRALLERALSDEDLVELCQDHFPEVYRGLSAEMSPRLKIRRLLDYCDRNLLLDSLLARVRQMNPAQYARYEA